MLLQSGIACLVLGALLGVAALASSRRQPNRIANGFLIELAALLLIDGVLYVLWHACPSSPGLNAALLVLFGVRYLLYALIGVALIVNGAVTVRREGLCLAHLLPFGWGALLLVVCYWFVLGPGNYLSGWEPYVQAMSFLTILMGYVPFAVVGVWLSNDICRMSRKAPETEYVVVLGCGIAKDGGVTPLLRGRLDAALAAWRAGGCVAKVICSGGQGPDEVTSEARAMANYLLRQGVPQEDILLEEKSTTTRENLRLSCDIMESRGGAAHFTVATSSYHCLRAALIARRMGLDVSLAGGRVATFFYPAAFFREYIALVVNNAPAVAAFFAFAVVRFALQLSQVMPETLF